MIEFISVSRIAGGDQVEVMFRVEAILVENCDDAKRYWRTMEHIKHPSSRHGMAMETVIGAGLPTPPKRTTEGLLFSLIAFHYG